MKKIFLCLLLLNFQLLLAQKLEWFEGSVVLPNNEVRVGVICLEAAHDLILFQQGESRTVYPAHELKSLYFYDKPADINRRYMSLRTEDGALVRHQLYEIVVSGDVSVLRRKKFDAFTTDTGADDYAYFALYDYELTPLNKFNRKIFPRLRSRSNEQLEKFISTNRLTTNQLANSIRIIEYYNSIVKNGEPFARN
jgi:hypothetical protein